MSCDKVSGQQHMQRALLDRCERSGIYAEPDDADFLCYVQVTSDESLLDKWKAWKSNGKKIVFIHHYMSKSFYERCNIFKVKGLFEEIDFHIIISKQSELYDYLVLERAVEPQKIAAYEQAGSEYVVLREEYFKFPEEKIDKSIMFCGKAVKGLDKFVELTKDMTDWRRIILCPDPEKSTANLNEYEIYTDKKFSEVYKTMSNVQFIYVPSVYNAPRMHLETVIQEAIPCGTLVIVDEEFVDVLGSDDIVSDGFVLKRGLKHINYSEMKHRQRRARKFQENNFYTLSEILDKNIETILSV